jgi:hypothetical protein
MYLHVEYRLRIIIMSPCHKFHNQLPLRLH